MTDTKSKSPSLYDIAYQNPPPMSGGFSNRKTAADVEAQRVAENGDQGFGGDAVDAFQMGAGQSAAGMAETVYQITGSETAGKLRDATQNWAEGQMDQMSDSGREAMGKQFFSEDENGDVQFGEAWSDPESISLQFSNMAGQWAGRVVTGFGFTGVVAKVGAKVVTKNLIKRGLAKGMTKEAAQEYAKSMIRSGAGVTGQALAGAGITGGQMGIQVRDEIMNLSDEELGESDEFRILFHGKYKATYPDASTRQLIDMAKKELAERTATAVQADPLTITANLTLDAIGGRYIDNLIRGVGTGKRLTNAGMQAIGQGIPEAAQGGMEQFNINRAMVNEGVDPDRDLMEGVATNALNEGVLGAGMGGAMGALTKGTPREKPSIQEESDTQAQDMPPLEQVVEEIKSKRGKYRGIDDDIRIAEKEGFTDEAAKLWAVKRNLELAWKNAEAGDRAAAERFHERAKKLYRDVFSENERQDSAESVAVGEYLERMQLPETATAREGETYDELEGLKPEVSDYDPDPSTLIPDSVDAPYYMGTTEEAKAARQQTERAMTEQQGQDPGNAPARMRPEDIEEIPVDEITIDQEPVPPVADVEEIPVDEITIDQEPVPPVADVEELPGPDAPIEFESQSPEKSTLAIQDYEPEQGIDFEVTDRADELSDRVKDQIRKHKLPKGLDDGRLLRSYFRSGLENMAGDLVPGGGVTYVRDSNDKIVKRTPSQNPKWFQDAPDNVKRLGVKGLKKTIDQALKGRPLGRGQARAVRYALDHITENRNEYARTQARPEREDLVKFRKVMRGEMTPQEAGFADSDPVPQRYSDAIKRIASSGDQRFTDADYEAVPGGNGVGRALADDIREALEAGLPENVVTEIAKQFGDDPVEFSLRLFVFTEAHKNGQEVRPASVVRAADKRALEKESADRGEEPEWVKGEREPEAEEELLTSYTEEDLRQKEAERQQAEKVNSETERKSQQKAKADAEVDSFALAGSDTEADQAAAAGQSDLLQEARNNYPDNPESSPDNPESSKGNEPEKTPAGAGVSVSGYAKKASEPKSKPAPKPTSDLPEILTATRKSYLKKMARKEGLKPSSPGYESAMQRIEDQYETDVDRAQSALSFEQFNELNSDSPEGLNRQAWTSLREEYGEPEQTEQAAPEDDDKPIIRNSAGNPYKNKGAARKALKKHPGYELVEVEGGFELHPVPEGAAEAGNSDIADAPRASATEVNDDFGPDVEVDSAPSTPDSDIDDVGEKLGGARKDELRTATERLSDLDDQGIADSTLSQLFPKGEINKIEDVKQAALYKVVRDEIPNKPRVRGRLKRWVDSVKSVRELLELASGEGAESLISVMREKGGALRNLADKVELLSAVDRKQWDRIKRVSRASGKYRDESGEMIPGSWYDVEIDGKRKAFYGMESVSDLTAPVSEYLGEPATKERSMKFEVRSSGGGKKFYINKKGDRERRALKTFDTLGEARSYIIDGYDDLVNAWESVKARDNVSKADTRGSKNKARVGEDWRSGKDVSPQEFIERFSIRGAEFGNWVKQGKGGRERQGLINAAYDAFMDLADTLNIPPEAIGLGGQLGIGFGSRGRGGRAAAHYEPWSMVINLTKTQGSGSLAHEWFHALDNYFWRKRGQEPAKGQGNYITFRPEPMMVNKKIRGARLTKFELERYQKNYGNNGDFADSEWERDKSHPEGVRPEVEKKFADLASVLNSSPVRQRSLKIDSKPNAYWSQIIELAARSFENYVIASLAKKGNRNDFLANVTPESEFARDAERYPYLRESELLPVEKAFDEIFETIEARKDGDKTILASLSDDVSAEIRSLASQFSGKSRVQTRSTAKQVRGWLEDMAEGMDSVEVVETSLDLPGRVKIDLGAYFDSADGAYDIKTGKTYIVAGNIRDQYHAKRVFLHEVVGHGGVINYLKQNEKLGGKAYLEMLDDIYYRAGHSVINKDIDRYAFDYDNPDERRIAVLEYIAHLAEKGKKMGLVQRAIAALRDLIRKFNPDIDWTDTDTLALIEKGRRHLQTHGNNGKGGSGTLPMVAYHGTPHIFDRFSLDAVGTGEGAQAYGWGLYFAGKKEIAEWYQKELSARRVRTKNGEFNVAEIMRSLYETERMALALVTSFGGDFTKARSEAIKRGEDREYLDALDYLEREVEFLNLDGNLYKADIPEDSELVDFDLPLSQQSDEIKDRLLSLEDPFITEAINTEPVSMDDGEYWSYLGNTYDSEKEALGDSTIAEVVTGRRGGIGKTPRDVSLALNSVGIPGLMYLNGDSRGGKGEDRNYVIWDESRITIEAVNDQLWQAEVMSQPGGGTILARLSDDLAEDSSPLARMSENLQIAQRAAPIRSKARDLLDAIRFQTQDKLIDLKNRQRGIDDLDDSSNAYQKAAIWEGRAGERINDFDEEHVQPLLEKIAESGLSLSDVGEWLVARHAKEANEYLAEINPDKPDSERYRLSGMSNDEADAILSRYRGNIALSDVGDMVDRINTERVDMLINEGLITEDMAGAWRSRYKNYVPLNREEAEGGDYLPPRGQGFQIKGKESKMRTGSAYWKPDKIISHVIANFETSIVRAEKNKVGEALLKFVEENPDEGFWSIDTERKQTAVRNGKVVETGKGQLADNELGVKRNGVDHVIVFNRGNEQAARLAKGLKNLQAAEMNTVMRTMAKATRFLAMINTSFNPEFMVTNFFRDVQTAAYNLSDTKISSMQKQVLKDIFPAGNGIRKALFGNGEGEWSELWEDFRKNGGKTGWIDLHSDIKEKEQDLVKTIERIRDGKSTKGNLKRMLDLIENSNTVVENGVRLAAYKAALDNGLTKEQAAALAKDLTVNFNRKGAMGPQLNAFYMFFNAAVQGNVRLLQAMVNSKKGRMLAYGTVGFAIMLDIFNRSAAGDDDDGENLYDSLPDYVKERNIIIMGEKEPLIKIPAPWGYNVLHVAGQEIGRAISGERFDPMESAGRVAMAVANSFNPLSSGSISQMLSPTVTDPIVMIAENKNFAGNPLKPEHSNDSQAPKPEYLMHFSTARSGSKWLTEMLNDISGGNEVRPGAINISPENIDLLIDTLTGGVGRLATNSGDLAARIITGEDIEVENVPFLRQVHGYDNEYSIKARYYEWTRDVAYAKAESRKLRSEELAEAKRDPVYKLIGLYNSTERRLRVLRKQRRKLEKRSATKERIESLDKRIRLEMARFNRQYIRIVLAGNQ